MTIRNIFYHIVKTLFRLLFILYNRLEVRGLDNVPSGVTMIIASNHASNIDPPLIGSVFPGRLRYLAKDSLFRVPLLGFFIKALGAIPVSRQDSQRAGAVMKLLLSRLRSGENILLFPEGTRSRSGELQPLEGGIAFLAIKSGAPILPVFVHGSHLAWPPGKKFPSPAKLILAISHPIFPDEEITDERKRRLALMKSIEDELRALGSRGGRQHD
ncbi:MAG: 1-acyl-sn-glycerol-3-phosphate acyltransferase [Synergistaceae bacterium]|jgi:1-acyl-sn-glycerol-3-phosphate acyltransferase|nr:1-acyl-sn-glycerol-3-phosphate acyltransferase [Synergistaceae bacterium]